MSPFMPHGFCMRWDFWLLFTHILSDGLIALAYFLISAALVYFVRKRQGMSFGFLFWLFSLFIFSCGVTHALEIWLLWTPNYWLAGWAKLVTAIISMATAIFLWRAIPAALQIPTAEEMKSANEQLRVQAVKRKAAEHGSLQRDNFLATLSHELRTPLNAILGWTQLLQNKMVPAEKTGEALEVIRRNALAQAKLIDELLDLSRIAAGKCTLELENVWLADVLNATVAALQPDADRKCITVETVLPPDSVEVEGDAKRLQQIVWNLLSNAVKFTPEGGRVTVALSADRETCKIQITDTGRGIAAEFLPHLFERFSQANSSSTRMQGGLGIGLALVQELSLLHNGSVRAESAGEGAGSTFTVTLPRAATRSAPPSVTTHARNLPASLSGVRILVVDDEKDSRDFLKELFRNAGAEVQLAGSAAKALETLKQYPPQVLVSDIAMPGHDGLWLIQTVRKLLRGGDVPAVAVTALASETDRDLILEAGFQAHLPKPVDTAELLSVVSRLAATPAPYTEN